MPIRATIVIVLACIAHSAVSAEPAPRHGCDVPARQEHHAASDVCRPSLPLPQAEPEGDDITAAQEPRRHAKVLTQIAIYAATGNREGVEILTAQLRALGVSRETVAEAVTWAKVHGGSHKLPTLATQIERGWEASQ